MRIGYVPRPLPIEGKWQPIPGSKSWQIKLDRRRAARTSWCCWTTRRSSPFMQDGPPKDEKVNWATYRKSDRTLMFNAGGKNPGQLGQVRIRPETGQPVAS